MKFFFYAKVQTPCASSKNLFFRVKNYLLKNDYEVIENPNEADYILFNTCGFLESIEKELIDAIRYYGETYQKKIIIFGCLGRISKELGTIEQIAHIINVGEEKKFDTLFPGIIPFDEIQVTPRQTQFGASHGESYVIQIARGCIQHCTFCATKMAIGHVKSRSVESIKKDFLSGLRDGHKRFFLTGDDIASYGKEIGLDFSDLFNALCEEEGEYIISLDHTETSEFVKIFPKIAHNFHRVDEISLPGQSFIDRKLALMGRKYPAKDFLKLASDIKAANPDTLIVNYIIYGYPTETAEEFRKELEGANLFDKNIFFLYSERPYTKKYSAEEKLPQATLRERTVMVYKLNKYASSKFIIGGFFSRFNQ